MSGDIEINKCDFCHEIKQVERTYLHPSKYVKGDYFIIIKTCAECGIPTTSQTEISDEEIEKAIDELNTDGQSISWEYGFREGSKWYREQLKKK